MEKSILKIVSVKYFFHWINDLAVMVFGPNTPVPLGSRFVQ